MKKYLLLFFIFFLHISETQSFTINGGISYTVESARSASFDNVAYKIDIKKYAAFFIDPNYSKNAKLITNNKNKYRNRFLTIFNNGKYIVRYKTNKSIAYFYTPQGKLYGISFEEKASYPKRAIIYNIKGELDSVCYIVSDKEQFIFDTNKKLIAHWIGNNGYNEKGELFCIRD